MPAFRPRRIGPLTRALLSVALLAGAAGQASAATFTVTTTSDSGAGSLRQAIASANASAGTHTIDFAIPGGGPHVIATTTELTAITRSGVTLDASTQTGASCGTVNQGVPHQLKVELRSAHANRGLMISADDVTVRGLSITNHAGSALIVNAGADRVTVECNNIGIRPDNTVIDGNANETTTNVAFWILGADATVANNVISGNAPAFHSLLFENTSGGTATGNLIGLKPDGTTAAANGSVGIYVLESLNMIIGGTTVAARNVIASNADFGVATVAASGVAILGNYIGTTVDGLTLRQHGQAGIIAHDTAGVEIGRVGAGNVVAGAPTVAVILQAGSDGVVVANLIGVASDGTTDIGSSGDGVRVVGTATALVGDGTAAGANTIANHAANGVTAEDTARAAFLANVIHSNGGLGIDLGIELGYDGVTANDTGDGDGGPNDLLNFPVLDTVTADGSTTLAYDLTLDVPAHGPGYRIDFYRSTTADPTGHGEGETPLGFVTVAHGGGALGFSGTFPSAVPVSPGDRITATVTRRTGAGSHDITSEFSLSFEATASLVADLVATKGVTVLDDGLIGGDDTVAIPGATLRYTITIRNEGAGTADADTTVIVDELPGNGAFRVADLDGTPGAGPVGFTDGTPSSGLTYGYAGLASAADDLEFSDDGGVTWTYAPADGGDGTDPNVSHIRVSPGGSFDAAPATPPSVALRYDVILF